MKGSSRELRFIIPYILVMGIIVAKSGLSDGNMLNFSLSLISVPCAVLIWMRGKG